MRTKSLLAGLLLAAVLVLVLAVPASAAYFPDSDGHPYEASILALADRGIIGGFEDGTFGPDKLVTRQQFAKMIVLALGLPVDEGDWQDATRPFVDMGADNTASLYPHEYVAICAQNNITKGKDATHFAPLLNITRAQVMTMVVRAADNLFAGTLQDVPVGWTDGVLAYSDPNHGANIKKAEYNGLLDGIWASTSPDPISGLAGWDTAKNATRGEVAEILAQLFYRTGKILILTGGAGTQEFTMAELKGLTAAEGFGGWKNKVDTIIGPLFWKGTPIQALMDLAGGGTTVTVVASDGYEVEYGADAVNGAVAMYDPETGLDITAIEGELTMILAYSVDGEALPSSFGALRIGFISPTDDQVTWSANWASLVTRIDVH